MDGLTPEMIQTLLQIGGTPALVGFIAYKVWNGTSQRIRSIEGKVEGIDKTLTRIDMRLQLEEELKLRHREEAS
jgi:hypothetical protein